MTAQQFLASIRGIPKAEAVEQIDAYRDNPAVTALDVVRIKQARERLEAGKGL